MVDEKFIEGTDLGTDADRTNYMLDAVTWVEERMKNDTLVSPEGILAYGMHYFLKSINPVQEEKLIAEQEWKEKRFAVLYENRNKLTKKS